MDGSLVPSGKVLEEIGNLTFTQLSQLRHRGAFTTVSQTFTVCCQSVKFVSSVETLVAETETTMLDVWYKVSDELARILFCLLLLLICY